MFVTRKCVKCGAEYQIEQNDEYEICHECYLKEFDTSKKENTLEPPKNINVYYIVSIYKDMELAEEIEFSETFENYLMARMFYEKEVEKAKHEYFITFEIEIEQEINEGKFETETIRLAHNFIKNNA